MVGRGFPPLERSREPFNKAAGSGVFALGFLGALSSGGAWWRLSNSGDVHLSIGSGRPQHILLIAMIVMMIFGAIAAVTGNAMPPHVILPTALATAMVTLVTCFTSFGSATLSANQQFGEGEWSALPSFGFVGGVVAALGLLTITTVSVRFKI